MFRCTERIPISAALLSKWAGQVLLLLQHLVLERVSQLPSTMDRSLPTGNLQSRKDTASGWQRTGKAQTHRFRQSSVQEWRCRGPGPPPSGKASLCVPRWLGLCQVHFLPLPAAATIAQLGLVGASSAPSPALPSALCWCFALPVLRFCMERGGACPTLLRYTSDVAALISLIAPALPPAVSSSTRFSLHLPHTCLESPFHGQRRNMQVCAPGVPAHSSTLPSHPLFQSDWLAAHRIWPNSASVGQAVSFPLRSLLKRAERNTRLATEEPDPGSACPSDRLGCVSATDWPRLEQAHCEQGGALLLQAVGLHQNTLGWPEVGLGWKTSRANRSS